MGDFVLTNDKLWDLYVNQGVTGMELARLFNRSPAAIYERLNRMGAPMRSNSEAHKGVAEGAKNGNWRGGRHVEPTGYVSVRVRPGKYVFEHRIVMEQHLGRPLEPTEVIHHLNRNRSDNRIENLQLLSSHAEHARLHADDCKNGLRRSTKGRTFKMKPESIRRGEAHHSTPLTKDDVLSIYDLAFKQHKSYSQIAAIYKINQASIGKIVTGKSWRHLEDERLSALRAGQDAAQGEGEGTR